MTATIKTKLDELLSHEARCNYDGFESMAESLIDEFTDEESAEFCYEITDAVEEWWNAQEDDGDEILADEERDEEESELEHCADRDDV